MKKLLWIGVLGLIAYELANVYFIMPMPGSQRMRSIDAAYAVYQWRWWARGAFGVMLLAGLPATWRAGGWRRALGGVGLVAAAALAYVANFQMAADHMFLQPRTLRMVPVAQNTVARDRLVTGIVVNGEARAYPLQFIGYHHQVRDSVGGAPVLVSYCTVCRTGRVFTPKVGETIETFRLVGMDHYNAMFEDRGTGSWWRQANGEAVTGPLKGKTLEELPSLQVTLEEWIALHPATLVMQADPAFLDEYAKDYSYEKGTSRKELTGTDTASWKDKSWVVGVRVGSASKAYDWNQLTRLRVINDEVGGIPIVVALAADGASFFAYQRPGTDVTFALSADSLRSSAGTWSIRGDGPTGSLPRVNASQEFWHSWRTFQPGSQRY